MNIQLLQSNRPTKEGLYIMQEHPHAAPTMVRVRYNHVAGDPEPNKDLIVNDSRSYHYNSSPLNENKADGGKWLSFISSDAKFSEEIHIS